MKMKSALACLALCAAMPAAFAQGYIGGSGGLSSWSVDCAGTTSCDNSGTGFKAFGGWMFNQNFGAEALYIDLGKAKATVPLPLFGNVNADIKGSGFGAAGVLAGRADALGFGMRLGFVSVDGKVTARSSTVSASTSKSSVQTLVGFFVGYEVAKNFDLRLDVDATRVKTGDSSDSEATVRLFSAGAVYRF